MMGLTQSKESPFSRNVPPIRRSGKDNVPTIKIPSVMPRRDGHQTPPMTADVTTTGAVGKGTGWPCANCGTTIKDAICPHCHGIQVKIKDQSTVAAAAGSNEKKQNIWVARLSPATVRRSPAPASLEMHPPLDKLIEIEDDEEELGASSPQHEIVSEEDDVIRPVDPVASTLASAPSPFPAGMSGETKRAAVVILETESKDEASHDEGDNNEQEEDDSKRKCTFVGHFPEGTAKKLKTSESAS